MKGMIAVCAALGASTVLAVSALDSPPPVAPFKAPTPPPELSTPEKASAAARAFLGQLIAPACQAVARLQYLDRDLLPRAELKKGTALWYVTFSDCELQMPGGQPNERAFRRDVTVALQQSGEVAFAEFVDPSRAQHATPEPSADSYQRQLAASSENWYSTASDPKDRDLAKAFEAIEKEMGGVRQTAKIIVRPLWWSFGSWRDPRFEYRSVWSIDLRGTPSPPPDRPEIPQEAKDHVRHIVDATTNKWLMATSVPQPDTVPSDKPTQKDERSSGRTPPEPAAPHPTPPSPERR